MRRTWMVVVAVAAVAVTAAVVLLSTVPVYTQRTLASAGSSWSLPYGKSRGVAFDVPAAARVFGRLSVENSSDLILEVLTHDSFVGSLNNTPGWNATWQSGELFGGQMLSLNLTLPAGSWVVLGVNLAVASSYGGPSVIIHWVTGLQASYRAPLLTMLSLAARPNPA